MRRYLAILLAATLAFATVTTDYVIADEVDAETVEIQADTPDTVVTDETNEDVAGAAGEEDVAAAAEEPGNEGETGTAEGTVTAEEGVQETGDTDLSETDDETSANDVSEAAESVEGAEIAVPGDTADETEIAEVAEGKESGDAADGSETVEAEEAAETVISADDPDGSDSEEADKTKTADVAFSYEETVDGYVISLSADPGVLPEGVTVKIQKVTTLDGTDVETLIEKELTDGREIREIVTFDITFFDKDGNEIEPEDGSVSVVIKLAGDMVKAIEDAEEAPLTRTSSDDEDKLGPVTNASNKDDAASVSVEIFHIDDNKNVEQVESVLNDDNEISFDAESFSLYSVALVGDSLDSSGPNGQDIDHPLDYNVNEDEADSFTQGSYVIYYQFNVPEEGYIDPRLKVESDDSLPVIHDFSIYYQQIRDNNRVFATEGIGLGTSNAKIFQDLGRSGIKAGKYIVKIHLYRCKGYTLRINYTPDKYYESEPDSSNNPKQIELGKEYKGESSPGNGDNYDYYYFILSKASKVTVNAKSDNVYFGVGVYKDKNCSEKAMKGESWSEFTYSDKLPPGTYYVRVNSGLSATSHNEYQFTITAESNDISDAEITNVKNKTYNGKKQVQSPVVKMNGKTLKENTDYKISYSNSINVGTATMKITGKGDYQGKKSVEFKIRPKGTQLSSLKKGKKSIKVVWNKQSSKMPVSRITGYQIQCATNKAFTKNKKSVKVKGYKNTSKKITGLKGGKTYYVRIRTYMTKDGVTYYSPWSAVKKTKTKK